MKIAVLSDIHGNLDALKAVMEDIHSQGAEKIFICGDVAMAGAEPAETIDYLLKERKFKDIVIIQGNTDEMILKSTGSPDDGYTPPNETMAEALKYAQKILSPNKKEFLFELAPSHSEKIDDISVLLVHGSPRRNNEDIYPDMPMDELAKIIEGVEENVIFCGHTHKPVIYHLGKKTVINAGSVGRPFADMPDACYVILYTAGSGKFEVNFRYVPYDYRFSAEKLSKLPFKGAEKLAQMLIKATSEYPD